MNTDNRRDPLGISGTLIADKYRVAHAVGEGGFSVVYLAEHTIWKQPVAIKCFKVLANAPPEQRDSLLDGFIQEGKLMASLSSRTAAIVQARDVGTFTTPDGQWLPYMVLEWLEGKPLDHVLWEENRAGLPHRTLEEAMRLLEPAATALEVVHSRNIAHRDIKPANFFILGDARSPDAHIKVLDFGIAKVMAEHAAAAAAVAQTGKDITAFTPNYGAPEQFTRSYGATGPWTDVFAMALILVEIIRGAPALEGEDLIQFAVASRDPNRRPSPRTFGIPVSDAVEQVFQKALAVAPADRYPTMGRFWAALYEAVFGAMWSAGGANTGLVGRAPTGQPPMSTSQPPMSSVGAPSTAMSGATPEAGRTAAPMVAAATAPRPTRAPLIGAAAAAVLMIGGGIAAWSFSASKPPPAPVAAASASAKVATTGATTAVAAPARRTECPEGMVLVTGGKFFMGSDDPAFKLWQPAHKVTIDTFCIDVHEVTAGDYKACSDVGECKRPPAVPEYPKSEGTTDEQHEKNRQTLGEFCNFGKEGREKHPINCVSWDLAAAYCKNKQKRLPTEAEWEYAARGSDGRKFPWGDEPGGFGHMNACGSECNKWETAHGLKPSPKMYDQDDGFAGTAPVGSFPKGVTKFGAYDFIGNVWEWTADWFETYKADEEVNPKGAPAGDRKAIRGGGFNGGVQLWLNPAFRYHQLAIASAPGIGFRCAASL